MLNPYIMASPAKRIEPELMRQSSRSFEYVINKTSPSTDSLWNINTDVFNFR